MLYGAENGSANRHANHTSRSGDWRGRVRGMDCVVPAAPRGASHFARRLGPGQLASFFGRGNPRDPRNLWTQPALYKNGRARHAIVERARATLEPPVGA